MTSVPRHNLGILTNYNETIVNITEDFVTNTVCIPKAYLLRGCSWIQGYF